MPLAKLQVFAKSLTGETIAMPDIDGSFFVAMFTKLVEENDGLPADRQRLIYTGRQLEDNDRLVAYSIHQELTIHIVGRLRGGDDKQSLW